MAQPVPIAPKLSDRNRPAAEQPPMPHDARIIASILIDLALREERPITPLQVNKLAYFGHAWMLGLYSHPLLKQEVIAYDYGPIIPDIYHALRRWGGEPITRQIAGYEVGPQQQVLDDNEEYILKKVWEKYGHCSGRQLSATAHAKGTPWHEVRKRQKEPAVIDNELIARHYRKKYERVFGRLPARPQSMLKTLAAFRKPLTS